MRINEVESSGGSPGDWVELFNRGTDRRSTVRAACSRTTTTPTPTSSPPGPRIAAGGYLRAGRGAAFGFGLGGADSAGCSIADGATSSTRTPGPRTPPTTYGRCPNGTGAPSPPRPPSPRAPPTTARATVDRLGRWPGGADVSTVDAPERLRQQPERPDLPAGHAADAGCPVGGAQRSVDAVPAGLGRRQWHLDRRAADGWGAGKTLRYPDGTGSARHRGRHPRRPDRPQHLRRHRAQQRRQHGQPHAASCASTPQHAGHRADRHPRVEPDRRPAGGRWAPTSASRPSPGSPTASWSPPASSTRRTGAGLRPGALPRPRRRAVLRGRRGQRHHLRLRAGPHLRRLLRVATITSGQAGVMGLEFDPDNGTLWAGVTTPAATRPPCWESPAPATAASWSAPLQPPHRHGRLQQRGHRLRPQLRMLGRTRSFFWCDDSNNETHALRRGTLNCGTLPAP